MLASCTAYSITPSSMHGREDGEWEKDLTMKMLLLLLLKSQSCCCWCWKVRVVVIIVAVVEKSELPYNEVKIKALPYCINSMCWLEISFKNFRFQFIELNWQHQIVNLQYYQIEWGFVFPNLDKNFLGEISQFCFQCVVAREISCLPLYFGFCCFSPPPWLSANI